MEKVIIATVLLLVLGAVFGAILSFAAKVFAVVETDRSAKLRNRCAIQKFLRIKGRY